MAESCSVRDPVYGFVHLDSKEADVLSSWILQRLRGIRQLAFAHLVYPGAHQTRFEHSLGVCHIAGLLADRLEIKGQERSLIRLSALVHDIGHGPFSHISEDVLEIYADRTKLFDRLQGEDAKIHELVTQDLITSDAHLKRIVGENDCAKISKLLAEGFGEPLLRSIVSGPLDADKQDYLLRDSHYCGVKYGVFDLDQMHRALIARDPGDGSKQLMITEEGIHALEQFVLAKYYMTTQVYRHKVRLITDQLLIRAITMGIDSDRIEELHKLYAYDGSVEFCERYIQWDDSKFLLHFGGESFSGTRIHRLLTRLRQRRLLKRVFKKKIREFPEHCIEPLEQINKNEAKAKRFELESNIHEVIAKDFKNYFDGDEGAFSVIVNSYKLKSVREQSRNNEGPILVDLIPNPKMFEQESTLFRSIDEKLSEAYVEVYAPVRYDSPVEKRKLLMALDRPITDILTEFPKEEEKANENT
jgi:HD superfamily phosphohydrolase